MRVKKLVRLVPLILFTLLFTLLLYAITITYVPPTPQQNTYQNQTSVYVNATLSDGTQQYGMIDWNRSLVLWLRMDDISQAGEGATVYDNSSYSSHAIAYNNAHQVSGRFGNAYAFDGDGDYLETTLSKSATTVSFWYKNSTTDWTHIANVSGIIYINGTATAQSPTLPIYLNGNTIQLGKFDASTFFNGSIDEIIVFNRALSSNEILNLYNTSSHIGNNFTGLTDGTYSYTIYGTDESGAVNSSTQNITIDTVPPSVELITPLNNTFNGTNRRIDFIYVVTDNSPINNCSLYLNGNLNATVTTPIRDVPINITVTVLDGTYLWNILCRDYAGNSNTSETRTLTVDLKPDLVISSSQIIFSNPSPVESENITINATIQNIGLEDATKFNVSFYEGNYLTGTQLGQNYTVNSLSVGTNITVSINWTAKQGSYPIYVVVDTPIVTNGSVVESEEENNYAYNTVTISSWQTIVGNLSGALVLSNNLGYSLVNWHVQNITGSKVYISDYESTIGFTSLYALGRAKDNTSQLDDFEELDTILELTTFPDSINTTYTSNNQVMIETNLSVFGRITYHTPIVNSTNNTQFFTAITWDGSDDGRNSGSGGVLNQYDATDKEDIVFITEARQATAGKYGTYDYEIRVPANLRIYYTENTYSIALYAELV